MKADIHPEYGPVLFRDLASGKVFLTRSTMTSAKNLTRSTPVSSASWTPQAASSASTHASRTSARSPPKFFVALNNFSCTP